MELWSTLKETFNDQKSKIENIEVEDKEYLPPEDTMYLEVGKWYRIRNVVSLYVDMEGSTKLSNERFIKTSAKLYEIFTGSLIRILKQNEFKAHFIDIKGDGGFALWKEKYGSVKALLAAVTFKTLVEKHLKSYVNNLVKGWEIKSKIGIAKGDVLVKRVGTRNTKDAKLNWAVWAGKTVNNSAKLSDYAKGNTILITDRVYKDISKGKFYEYLVLSCDCSNGKELWEPREDLSDEFNEEIWELQSRWCDKHGEAYINKVIELIKESE